MSEHDLIVLTREVPEHGLRAGDIGTIVHMYPSGAVEAEFARGSGEAVAVLTLTEPDFRAIGDDEILHARNLTDPPAGSTGRAAV